MIPCKGNRNTCRIEVDGLPRFSAESASSKQCQEHNSLPALLFTEKQTRPQKKTLAGSGRMVMFGCDTLKTPNQERMSQWEQQSHSNIQQQELSKNRCEAMAATHAS